MRTRWILTTLALGLGLVAVLLWLLDVGIPDTTRAQRPEEQEFSARASVTSGTATTVSYVSTTLAFTNPERGFCRFFKTYAPITAPLTPAMLDGITDTLIFRMYYLTPFTQTRISDDYLNMITNDMQVMRDAGKKAIVRFAYKDDFSDNDASLVQVMEHLDQLEDRLRDNSDVIAVLQAGFIGSWGEWHNGHPDFGNPDPNWSARRQVVTRLLEILPPSRMIQLRTPRYKYNIFSDTVTYSNSIPFPVPLAESQAHSGSDVARTGHHNDCFLCNPSDAGTYVYTPTEYPYLQQETEYVGMGGETGDYHECSDYDPDRLECETAMQELEWFHWSFLNRDWYTGTHAIWRDGSCFDEIERRLGYRFTLLQGAFDNRVRPGNDFHFSLEIENEGFAAPFNPRDVELVLRHTEGSTFTFKLPYDPRFWLPGETYTISHTISISSGMPTGNYELLLYLPDPEPTLHHRPEYAIRLANEDTWEASTGYNRLNHFLVIAYDIYLPIILKGSK